MGDYVSDMSAEFQALQQQLQAALFRKEHTALQLAEIERASKELENAPGDVFKMAGPLLIKSDKESVKAFLDDEKTTIEARLELLKKQEKAIREKLERIQSKLMETYKPKER